MRSLILVFLFPLLFFSCEEDTVIEPLSLRDESDIEISSDPQGFNALNQNRNSDDFDIIAIQRQGDMVEITVQYGGGCEPHDFEILWNNELMEVENGHYGFNMIELYLAHNSNGDGCEALLSDTLYISLNDLDNSIDWEHYAVRLKNASRSQDVVGFSFIEPVWESESCLVEVTAERVICGDGLLANLWFKYAEDTLGTSHYFSPASIASFILLDPDIPDGNRYNIGVKVTTWEPYPDTGICAAFPGFSVPVEIWCLEIVE